MMTNRFQLPALGFGAGLRFEHYDHVLEQRPRSVDWFEIITENFIDAHPGYWDFLHDLRKDYPIVMHGVSLSVGSTDPLNLDYLARVKKLADAINPPWVSDHVCWTGVNGKNTHDLLPLPYTRESLAHTACRVRRAQDALGRTLLLENPSSYVDFADSTLSEWDFLAELAEQGDCALLLDVNNVYVSAFNHGFDARRYIDAIPADRVVQIHLAGHKHYGTHIIDTHDDHVTREVWELYRYAIAQLGPVSTMVEWDAHIPPFETLEAEISKARAAAAGAPKEAA
jgi:uncharacterized protein (UPF0276 family)